MAILFPSPKRKKRVLFWSMSSFIILILAAVFLSAFPLNQKNLSLEIEGLVVPDVKINFDFLNSGQTENLEPFLKTELEIKNIGKSEPFLPYYQQK